MTRSAIRSPLWRAGFWAAAALLGLLAAWARWYGLLLGDPSGLHLAQSLPGSLLRIFALLASTPVLVAFSLLLAWGLRRKLRPLALIALLVPLPVIEWILKFAVQRARPHGDEWGFPSGHAIGSLVLALLVASALWPTLTQRQKGVVAILAAVFVLGVAAGRLGMGLHWPSDILGGWLVAFLYASLAVPLVRRAEW